MFKNFNFSIPKRYIIILMVFCGHMNVNYLRTNLSMALITMTSTQQIILKNGTECYLQPEFNWNSKERAVILSSFNYGFMLGPVGGILTGKFGGATIYGIAIAVSAVVTFFSPLLLGLHFALFFLANVLIGLSEAFAYASTSQLWSRWAPLNERSKFVSFGMMGAIVGPILSFLVAGFILKHWNWSVLYYLNGIITFIWYWIWFLVVYNDPNEDRHISENEKNYIKEKTQQVPTVTSKINYPWKKIFTCIPFLVGCFCKFSLGSGTSFATGYLPQFIKDLNNLDIAKIGYVSTIPMICGVVSMPLCGFLSDYLRKNKIMSLTNVHKLHISISMFTGTIVFIIIRFWPRFIINILCLSIFYFFLTFTYIDTVLIALDLAPQYAGLLNSLSNVFATLGRAITPAIVGIIVTNHNQNQWNTCFLILSAIYFFTACLFLKFGSGDLQPWANHVEKEKNQKSEDNDS